MRLKDLQPIDMGDPGDKAGLLAVDTEGDTKSLSVANLIFSGSKELEMTADNGDRIVLKVTSFKGADGQTYYSLDPVKKA